MPDCIQTLGLVGGVRGQQTSGNDNEGTMLADWLLKSPQLWVQVPEVNIFFTVASESSWSLCPGNLASGNPFSAVPPTSPLFSQNAFIALLNLIVLSWACSDLANLTDFL